MGVQSLLQPENKKDAVVYLAGARSLLRPEKKDTVDGLAGARSVLRPGKKNDTVVCLAGARSLLRPEKKRYSRLSGRCAIVITTGKKKIQSPVWRMRDRFHDRK